MSSRYICDVCSMVVNQKDCWFVQIIPPESYLSDAAPVEAVTMRSHAWDVCKECLDLPLKQSNLVKFMTKLLKKLGLYEEEGEK